uniref:TGACG-sequence-specific DNA-binding protein TGA-1B n=1 Tax=Solanum tuberosum TaxID=4113 RepID=M1D800_SOLTU
MGSFDDACGTFKSTLRDCLGEALGSNSIQMDHNRFGQPGNELIGNFSNSARNVELMSEEMITFAGNQAAEGVMVMDMSSPGICHSWSSLGVLDKVSPSLHQVSTDVSEYLKVSSPNCGSNLTKGLNNLLDPNKSVHSSPI